jgi:hypothetical protein
MTRAALATLAIVGLGSTMGCALEAEPLEDVDSTEDDLRVDGASGFTLMAENPRQPKPGEPCVAHADWKVDLTRGRLVGFACSASGPIGYPVPVQRDLTLAERQRVQTTLAAVRTTSRDGLCPARETPTTLRVTRGTRETRYTARASSCLGGTPVTDASMSALVTLLNELGEQGARKPVGGGLCDGVSCGRIAGKCWDRASTPGQAHEAFAGFAFTYRNLATTSALTFRDEGVGSVGGGRAGDMLYAWLRAAGGRIALDGQVAGITAADPHVGGLENIYGKATLRADRIEFNLWTDSSRYSCALSVGLE